jgi:hypothetical protein
VSGAPVFGVPARENALIFTEITRLIPAQVGLIGYLL